jgi:hypothetical protein
MSSEVIGLGGGEQRENKAREPLHVPTQTLNSRSVKHAEAALSHIPIPTSFQTIQFPASPERFLNVIHSDSACGKRSNSAQFSRMISRYLPDYPLSAGIAVELQQLSVPRRASS